MLFSCGGDAPKETPTNKLPDTLTTPPTDDAYPEFTIFTIETRYHDTDDKYAVSVIRTREEFQEYVDAVVYTFDGFAENTIFTNPSGEGLRIWMNVLNRLMDDIELVETFDDAFFAENDLVLLTIWISGNVSCFELDEVKQIDDEWFFDICRVINSGTEGIIYKSAAIVVNKERGIQEDKITVNLTDRF